METAMSISGIAIERPTIPGIVATFATCVWREILPDLVHHLRVREDQAVRPHRGLVRLRNEVRVRIELLGGSLPLLSHRESGDHEGSRYRFSGITTHGDVRPSLGEPLTSTVSVR